MFPLRLISERATESKLSFLLIGHAVNVYAEPRATLDIDVLIRTIDAAVWRRIIEAEGFKLFRDGGNFLQFAPPYGVNWRLDFMLVNEDTFAKLMQQSREAECLGIRARVPSPTHLIAMKLHALRHGPADREEKDFMDVVGIARNAQLNIDSPEFTEMFAKHGSAEIYEKLKRRLQRST
jgi:hypothetical protein